MRGSRPGVGAGIEVDCGWAPSRSPEVSAAQTQTIAQEFEKPSLDPVVVARPGDEVVQDARRRLGGFGDRVGAAGEEQRPVVALVTERGAPAGDDPVVAAFVDVLDRAVQPGQGAREDGCAGRRGGPRYAGELVGARLAEGRGHVLLAVAQHVDAEVAVRLDVRPRA